MLVVSSSAQSARLLGRVNCTARSSLPSSIARPVLVSPSLCSHSRPLSTSSPRKSVVGTTLLLSFVGFTSYILGGIYPPSIISIAFPSVAPPRIPSDTPEAEAHITELEEALHALPLVRNLRVQSLASGKAASLPSSKDTIQPSSNPQSHRYVMTRPYLLFSPERSQHHLVAGCLRGPGMVALSPIVFFKTDLGAKETGGQKGDCTIIIHLGRSLCGHDGILHGGVLATICDEALFCGALHHLPNNIGVTARLEIDYRKPAKADQFLVINTRLLESKGRKAIVAAEIKDLKGNILVESRAIFIEPKYAKYFLDTKRAKALIEG